MGGSEVSKVTLFLASLLLLALLVSLKLYAPEIYTELIKEDGLLEWMQCILYLLSSALSFRFAYLLKKSTRIGESLMYLLLAFALLFIGGEEVSWGHSFLGLELPDYISEHNVQGDLTLHNLDTVQPFLHDAYIVLGLSAGLSWILAPVMRYWRVGTWFVQFVPPWFLSFYFLPVAMMYGMIEYISPWLVNSYGWGVIRFSFDPSKTFFQFKDQEPTELMLALGFLLLVLCKSGCSQCED